MDSKDAALAAMQEFFDSFNDQDHGRHVKSLNYPHVRLANGRFARLESAEQYERQCRAYEPQLKAEGWHHSKVSNVEVVQDSDDKVHMIMTMDRCDAEDRVYNSFQTFWIATLVDGHWGIQFRSSFLT